MKKFHILILLAIITGFLSNCSSLAVPVTQGLEIPAEWHGEFIPLRDKNTKFPISEDYIKIKDNFIYVKALHTDINTNTKNQPLYVFAVVKYQLSNENILIATIREVGKPEPKNNDYYPKLYIEYRTKKDLGCSILANFRGKPAILGYGFSPTEDSIPPLKYPLKMNSKTEQVPPLNPSAYIVPPFINPKMELIKYRFIPEK